MIAIQLPNGRQYEFRHVVFDYNGVLAENGRVSEKVRQLLTVLASKISVTVITADTLFRGFPHGGKNVDTLC